MAEKEKKILLDYLFGIQKELIINRLHVDFVNENPCQHLIPYPEKLKIEVKENNYGLSVVEDICSDFKISEDEIVKVKAEAICSGYDEFWKLMNINGYNV